MQSFSEIAKWPLRHVLRGQNSEDLRFEQSKHVGLLVLGQLLVHMRSACDAEAAEDQAEARLYASRPQQLFCC